MILAIVQARMSSTRLPGKVLLPLAGRPMLYRQLQRVGRSRTVGKLVVATSDHPSDDRLAGEVAGWGWECFRGSLIDVLDRYYRCMVHYQADYVVRITADCPLIDPAIIDATVGLLLQTGADYASADAMHSWPDGMDVSVLTRAAVERSWRDASDPAEREHMIKYIENRPDQFSWQVYRNPGRLPWPGLRLSVDTAGDYRLVAAIFDCLHSDDRCFSYGDIINLLQRCPELLDSGRFGQA
ncbi:MAG: glycosyltransferase family protein [Negativicutes bacterium]|nr:glycosyltransferase family protein [Negativicutes bacterium]